jgi:glycosyltransferase involved in cell wall biosynthesis
MHLLIVLPKQQVATGNFVTARRLQVGLQNFGVTVDLLAIAPEESALLAIEVERTRPDQLLLLHAWRCGLPWLICSPAPSCPTTVLLTGTDINQGIDDSVQGGVIHTVLQNADGIVSQNRLTVDTLQALAPLWINRLHYIPAGVLLGQTPYSLRRTHGISKECRLFLHPAGIRPVKANLELLELCAPLAEINPDFAIAFCGPELDPDYSKQFLTAVDQRAWAYYLGTIPSDAMPSALAEADLILNHSLSEGMSNALIEALAVGRPVLARDIPGNAAILTAEELYSSDEEFLERAQQLLSSPHRLKPPLSSVPPLFSAECEAKEFAALFKSFEI